MGKKEFHMRNELKYDSEIINYLFVQVRSSNSQGFDQVHAYMNKKTCLKLSNSLKIMSL